MMLTIGRKIHVAFALLLVFVLVLPGIVGCSTTAPPAPTPTPTPTPTPAPTTARVPTGKLMVVLSTLGAERWSPHVGIATEMTNAGSVYDFLVYRKPGSVELMPGVAEKWEMSKDGLTWNFYLRKGIKFHGDWGELTAQDVKKTYDIILLPESKSSLAPYFRASVKSVEAVNPYQAVFNMKVPTWDLAYRVSAALPYFAIVSSKYIDKVGLDVAAAKPIGSGPYKFADHKQGQYLELEALTEHWRQVPYFKTLVFKGVPEAATRMAMLRTGEADVIEITQELVPEIEKAGLKVIEIPNAKTMAIHFGGVILPTRPPYDSKIPWVNTDPEKGLKVRKAIALAINKEDIIKYTFAGKGKPIATTYFLPDMPMYDSSWKPYPYDPEQAKKLLAEAGYPNGFDLTMYNILIAGRTENKDVAEVVTQQLGKVGIRAKIESMEQPKWRQINGERKVGQALYPLSTSRFDEPVQVLQAVGGSKAVNFLGVEDPKLDDMVAKAISELDYDKRLIMQKDIGKYMIDNYYWIGIAAIPSLYGASKKVGEWPLTPAISAYLFYYEYLKPGTP